MTTRCVELSSVPWELDNLSQIVLVSLGEKIQFQRPEEYSPMQGCVDLRLQSYRGQAEPPYLLILLHFRNIRPSQQVNFALGLQSAIASPRIL